MRLFTQSARPKVNLRQPALASGSEPAEEPMMEFPATPEMRWQFEHFG
jgi:hypothetical protein